MGLTHLLDTSVYSQPIRPHPSPIVTSKWAELGDDSLAISVICDAEVRFGLARKGSARLNELYELWLKGRFDVIPVDQRVAETFATLKAALQKQGRPREDLDLLIAATAKTHRLILATLNYRHFAGIEGLAVEDWSKD